jgi:hypothetical protein
MKTLVADAGGSSTQVQGRRGNENGRKECGVQGVRRFRRPTPSPSVSHTKKDPENRASSDYENFPTRREKRGGGHSAMLCDAM